MSDRKTKFDPCERCQHVRNDPDNAFVDGDRVDVDERGKGTVINHTDDMLQIRFDDGSEAAFTQDSELLRWLEENED